MQFRICTIVNDPDQYRRMRASFAAGGFGPGRCRFDAFDNSAGNAHEPYALIDRLAADTAEPYLIVCHQDLLLDGGPGGHGIEQLSRCLDELAALDPTWAVAGNAGVTRWIEGVTELTQPRPDGSLDRPLVWRAADLPRRVVTLDENFLVLRTAARPTCSAGLSGFHLYGTDLCLNAARRGMGCYVIDFHLTHLSAGNHRSAAFDEARQALERHWNPHFLMGLVSSPCVDLAFSRFAVVRRLFAGRRPFRRRLMGDLGCTFFPTFRPLRHLAAGLASAASHLAARATGTPARREQFPPPAPPPPAPPPPAGLETAPGRP